MKRESRAIRLQKVDEVINLLKGNKVLEAKKRLDYYSIDIAQNSHQILREFLFFNTVSSKEKGFEKYKEILNFINSYGDYEDRYPNIALKIHATLGNKEKIKDFIENRGNPDRKVDIHSTQITYRNFIVDMVNEECPEMIDFIVPIISKLKPKDKPSMEGVLKECAQNNLPSTLKTIFKHKGDLGITDEDMRECAYHAIVKNNPPIFRLTCQNASKDALLKWKTHFENMHKVALIDPIKRKYDREIALVDEALRDQSLKLKLKKQNYESCDIEV